MASGWINGKPTAGIFLCAALVVLSAPVRGQDAGAALYKTKCAACHGPDGKGETAIGKANKLRDLGSAEVQKQSDAELAAVIENGKGKMPAYGKSLKPEQVKDLVAYVRSFAKK
jgi:mono/diheme cytochrome c family protein